MPLHCPFCHASEDGRIEAQDEDGEKVILVMFKCPFHYRFASKVFASEASDESVQRFLDEWKKANGIEWLESIGPVLGERERRNMQKYQDSSGQAN
jgi:hypothetical protein